MQPKFSLRAHKVALTCLAIHQEKLVSSDRDGFIIVWDLATRRPMALWKAHDGHILTLKSTDMGLLSHGRDSMIRIWDLSDGSLKPCSKNSADFLGVRSANSKSPHQHPNPLHVEIPVNALNFCNVDYTDGLLITPATTNSDNFDIYKVADPFGGFDFRRVLKNISPSNLSKSETLIEEIGNSLDNDKRGGHGIIMRTLFVSWDLFFVGYESGAIYGFRMEDQTTVKSEEHEKTVLFQSPKLTIVFSSNDHKPSPILSLKLDLPDEKLYTGSASKKLISYDIEHLLRKNRPQRSEHLISDTHNLRHYGIQCIQTTPDMILTGFWDGMIKSFTKGLVEISRLDRKQESIRPESESELARPAKKSICMEFWDTRALSSNERNVVSRKTQLRRASVGLEPLLFVGFGDGLITAFDMVH